MADTSEIEWLRRVRDFAAQTIAPAAIGWSFGENPSPDHFLEAGELGLFGIEVPVAQDGLGLGIAAKVAAMEILAAADFGFAMSVINTHNITLRLALSASERLKDQFIPDLLAGRMSACTALTEPGAGSDLAAIATTSQRSGSDWILNGEKNWIINARHAGLALVYAQTDPALRMRGLGTFLVALEVDGVTRHAIDSAFSQTSIGTGGFTMDAVRLDEDRMILSPGTAFREILEEINGARTYVAGMCCGMLDAALNTVTTYGIERKAFGKPLAENPAWRQVRAEAEIALAGIRALTAQSVGLIAKGADARLAAAQAKIAAVETCQRHLPALLHAMGAEGLRAEHCLARHLAAVQVAGFTDGATAVLKQNVGKLPRPSHSIDEA